MLFEKIENLVMLIKRKKQYKEMGEMRKGHASQGPSSSFSLASLSSWSATIYLQRPRAKLRLLFNLPLFLVRYNLVLSTFFTPHSSHSLLLATIAGDE